ncbi:hypothetical protein B0H15DRAFT_957688 [Mycena belliarum]|uniref:F-box domain-containing protein n=1 Tax=Mycena belliarum TaxID=1033014 RepID=A0AAD6TPG0_9AGAR|nr:hypothetical protein B0H15DRAFT_957688 [Mycena belliae]
MNGATSRNNLVKLSRIVRRTVDGAALQDILGRLDTHTLYRLVLENDVVAAKVLAWCRSQSGPELRLSSGDILVLPTELLKRILYTADYRSRVLMAETCRALYDLSSALGLHELVVLFSEHNLNFVETRLMLLATHTLVGGLGIPRTLHTARRLGNTHLEFFVAAEECDGVRGFLARTGGFRLKATVEGGKYIVLHMRKGRLRIKLIRCPASPIAGVLLHQFSAAQGFCNGDTIRHPYPALLNKKLCLTTPRVLPIDDDLEGHVAVWKTVRSGIRHGFRWVSEFGESHICGEAPSCPATFRHSRDAGWSALNLPSSRFGTAFLPAPTCWSLYGTGCAMGTLKDGEPCPMPVFEGDVRAVVLHTLIGLDEDWYSTVNAFVDMVDAPAVISDYRT